MVENGKDGKKYILQISGYTLPTGMFFFNEQNIMHTYRGELLLLMLDSEMPAVLMGETVADKQPFPQNDDVETLLTGSQSLGLFKETLLF